MNVWYIGLTPDVKFIEMVELKNGSMAKRSILKYFFFLKFNFNWRLERKKFITIYNKYSFLHFAHGAGEHFK